MATEFKRIGNLAEEQTIASEKQLEIIMKALEGGTLSKKTITKPLFFNAPQAKRLGIEIGVEENIVIEPSSAGQDTFARLITPEGQSQPAPLEEISTPELREVREVSSIFPDVTLMEFSDRIASQPEVVLSEIVSHGRNEDTEALLDLLGLSSQEIDAQFTFSDIPEQGQPFIYDVQVDGIAVRRQGTLTPDGIVTDNNQTVGVTNLFTGQFISVQEIERLSGPTDEEATRILSLGQVPQEEIDKILEQSKLDLTAEEWLDKYKTINSSFRKDFLYAVGSRSVSSGIGGIVQAAGGIAGWAKQEQWRKNLLGTAEILQSSSPERIGWTGVETLVDPRFWQTTVLETMTFSMALMPASILAAYASVPVAGALGLGAMGASILAIAFGSAGGGLVESAFESGNVWNEGKALGFTDEEADRAAGSVYWKNAATLTAMRIPEFAFAFGVNPFGATLARMTRSGLVRVGRLGVPALTEGGQEFLQDIYTRQALGQPIKWDDEAKLAVVLGAILGFGVGLGGNVFTSIQERAKSRYTPEMQEIYDTEVQLQFDLDIDENISDLMAQDKVAETEEGKKLYEDVAKEIQQEELEKVITSTDKVENLATQHSLDAQRVEPVEPVTIEDLELTEVQSQAQEQGIAVERIDEGSFRFKVTTETETIKTRNLEQAREIVETGEVESAPETVERISIQPTVTPTGIEPIAPILVTSKQIFEATLQERGRLFRGIDNHVARLQLAEVITSEQAREFQAAFITVSDRLRTATKLSESGLDEFLSKLKAFDKPLPQPTVTPQAVAPEIPQVPIVEGVAVEGADISETAPPEIINETTPDTVDETPIVNDINVIERFRPTRFVFEKMGLFDIWQSTFEAETLRAEEQTAFSKELNKHAKAVGKDIARRELVWEFVDNSSQEAFKQLTFEEKQAALWWKRTADDWADRLNISESRRIKDYIPHIFDDAAKQAEDSPIDASFSMVFSKKITDKVKMPFLEQRLGKELGLVKDPFLAAQAYQNLALRKFYYEPILQQLKLISEHESTPAFAARYLKEYSRRMTGEPANIDKEINKFLVDVADNVRGLPGGGTLADFLSRGNAASMAAYNLTSALYVMWLGFKPTSAIRNLSQHGLIIAEVDNIQDFGNGIRLRLTQEGRTALGESLVVRSRKGAFIESIDSSMAARWTDSVRETALFLFRKADEQNVKDAFLSGYAEAKRLYPEAGRDLWIKRGDEVAADTQYLYTKMNSLEISQSGPGKVGAMLTTWAINWLELMNKFVRGRQSRVYTDLVRTSEGRFTLKEKNWLQSRKSLLAYIAIVGLAYGLNQQDWNRVRAFEYTGFTSINTFANLLGGEFPGLELPGSVADIISGTLLGNQRDVTSGWNNLKRSFSILNQVDRVASGEREWLSLFFYLEGKDFQVRKLKEDWEGGWKSFDEIPTTNSQARKKWREDNPKLEAQMFITNRFSTLSSEEGRDEVLRLIDKHNIDTEVINGYEKIFGVDTSVELGVFQKRIGNLEKLEIGEEAKYFTTSNFLTETNKMVKTNGRDNVERDGNKFASFALGQQDSWQPYEDYNNADARRLYRQLNPDVEASLYMFGRVGAFENPESAKILLKWMDEFNIPPQAIPAFNENPDKYDELFTPKFELERKNFELTAEFEGLSNPESDNFIDNEDDRQLAEDKFKEDNPQWVDDMRRIEAIDKGVSKKLQDGYVEYYSMPALGFGQERFLKDNPDYYNEVWLGVLGNKEINFDRIPTVKFEDTFIEYGKLELGNERYTFRGNDLNFDAEGVRLGMWKPWQQRKVKPKADKEPIPRIKEPAKEPSGLEEIRKRLQQLK